MYICRNIQSLNNISDEVALHFNNLDYKVIAIETEEGKSISV